MAKLKPSSVEESGTIGDRVYYTRFGKTFNHRRPTQINEQKSGAQLRQRALFKAMQRAAGNVKAGIPRIPIADASRITDAKSALLTPYKAPPLAKTAPILKALITLGFLTRE